VCREADILVAALGRPGFIDAGFVKPGACVLDVGINRVDDRVVGDVDRESVESVAGWLTPVPKGVGPMTVAMLMRNTLDLARRRRAPELVPQPA
jgi:methylenetetrahydrofolate dehydrogenase (NADP+)/methenyltetrahydrofolate cyclohydrolase